jgi:hypothetical protein
VADLRTRFIEDYAGGLLNIARQELSSTGEVLAQDGFVDSTTLFVEDGRGVKSGLRLGSSLAECVDPTTEIGLLNVRTADRTYAKIRDLKAFATAVASAQGALSDSVATSFTNLEGAFESLESDVQGYRTLLTDAIDTVNSIDTTIFLTTISDKSVSDLSDVDTVTDTPGIGQVLKWNGTSWVPGDDLTGSGNITTLGGVIISNPQVNHVLKFNGATWINEFLTYNLNGLTDTAVSGAQNGQVLKYNGTAWVNDFPSQTTDNTLQSRATVSVTTTSIADGESIDVTIPVAKSYVLISIEVSHTSRVVLYTDPTARVEDVARLEATPATQGIGVITDLSITGPGARRMTTPGVIGFNYETPVDVNTYAKVTNKSGGAAAVTVSLTYVKVEY